MKPVFDILFFFLFRFISAFENPNKFLVRLESIRVETKTCSRALQLQAI